MVSYDGLILIWDVKWDNIIVEIDCAQALTIISDKTHEKSNRDLVIRIHELCRRNWLVVIQKVSREANVSAYILGGVMRNFSYDTKMFKEVSTEIIEQLHIDE